MGVRTLPVKQYMRLPVQSPRETVDLTHALGLRMVAEGVEDEQTLAILNDLGCDLVQGWHLGRPMPAVGFEAFLASRGAVVPVEPPSGPSVDLAS